MLTKLAALKNHAGFMRYFKNTSWMMAEQLLRILAGLFVGIWVARYLGPEQFGLFSYVLAFTAIFGGIAKLGLDGIMVRELVNNPENRDIYLGTAFWLKVIGAFIVMGLMAAIVPFTSNDATTNTFIFIIAAGLVFQSFEVVEFYFQSQVLAKIVSICKVTQLALSSSIKIYLVLTEAELIWFVLVTAFDALSLAISYFIAYKIRKNPTFYKHFDLSMAKQLLKYSWPLIFSSIVIMVYMRIDQIMIKEMLGEYEVGIYSAAVRLSEAFYFIPMLITTSLFPAIITAKKKGIKQYEKRMIYLYRYLLMIVFLVTVFVFIWSDPIVGILYGHEYLKSSSVLDIYIFGFAFVVIGMISSKYAVIENLQKEVLILTVLGAIINVLLNLYFIPVIGVNGAALATVISYLFANVISLLIFKRTRSLLFLLIRVFYEKM